MRNMPTWPAAGPHRKQPESPARSRRIPGGKENQLLYEMFLYGPLAKELGMCLEKKRLQLISAGARADNLPARDDERAAFAAALAGKAAGHVRQWFSANADFSGLPAPAQACMQLIRALAEGRQGEPGLRPLWRAVLGSYSQENSSDVLAFLNGSWMRAADMPPAADLPAAITPQEVLSAAAGPTAAPAQALAAVRWPQDAAELDIEDTDKLIVLAQRATVLPSGQFFIRIGGIFSGEQLAGLTPELAAEIFPERGDATCFPNTVHAGDDAAGSLAVWRVERRSSGKGAHYAATAFLALAYEVFRIPHSQDEPDLVREWIRSEYVPRAHVFPMFRLQDGLFIKTPSDITEPASADFDAPLNCYPLLRILDWHGRQIVAGPLQAAEHKYDCAPPRTVVRRLLRDAADLASVPPLTKAQITALADAAARTAGAGAGASARAGRHLENLFSHREEVDAVIADILKLPLVAEGIALERQRAAAEASVLGSAARAELAKLAAEKKQLQSESEKARQANKKEAAALARETRLAFEHAAADGMKSLASIALFKNVLGFSTEGTQKQAAAQLPGSGAAASLDEAAKAAQAPSCAGPVESARDMNRIFKKWYSYSGISVSLLQVALAAAASSGIAALRGSRSAEARAALAHILCGGIHCVVSVSGDMFGVGDLMNASAALRGPAGTGAMTLGDLISQRQRAGETLIVSLSGANRMPPESYFPELLAACRERAPLPWTDRKGNARAVAFESPVLFIADFPAGRSVFPASVPLAWDIPVLDTDAPWPDYSEPIEGESMPTATVASASLIQDLAASTAGAWPAPAGMPWNARRLAESIARACAALGMDQRSCAAPILAALAHGRLPAADAASLLAGAGGRLADEFGAYAAEGFPDYYFDMGSSQ